MANGGRRSRDRERLRSALYRAQGGRCGICGQRLGSLLDVTIEHVFPRAHGGTDALNVVAAHAHCNRRKRDRLPTGCEQIWLLAAVVGRALEQRMRQHGRAV